MHIIRNSATIAKPSPDDLAYYRRELDRIRRIATLRRELGEPDALLEMGVDALERRLEAIGAGALPEAVSLAAESTGAIA